MLITLNGSPVETAAPTVAALLGDVAPGRAVAVNGDVLPRAALRDHPLAGGDVIEVVEAVAGG